MRLTDALLIALCASVGYATPVTGQSAAGSALLRGARAERPAANMAHVPAGSFMPLYDGGTGRVAVAAFRLDRYPVTRAQYATFRKQPAVSADHAERPVTRVTQGEAMAYCAARGGRLPTETEWEYAAAASTDRRDGLSDPAFRRRLLDLYTTKRGAAPGRIGSTFRNAYGVHDMHGLVWEWVAPSHDHHASEKHDMSCAGSARGATTTRDFAAFMRVAYRSGLTPDMRQPGLGFRCAS